MGLLEFAKPAVNILGVVAAFLIFLAFWFELNYTFFAALSAGCIVYSFLQIIYYLALMEPPDGINQNGPQ